MPLEINDNQLEIIKKGLDRTINNLDENFPGTNLEAPQGTADDTLTETANVEQPMSETIDYETDPVVQEETGEYINPAVEPTSDPDLNDKMEVPKIETGPTEGMMNIINEMPEEDRMDMVRDGLKNSEEMLKKAVKATESDAIETPEQKNSRVLDKSIKTITAASDTDDDGFVMETLKTFAHVVVGAGSDLVYNTVETVAGVAAMANKYAVNPLLRAVGVTASYADRQNRPTDDDTVYAFGEDGLQVGTEGFFAESSKDMMKPLEFIRVKQEDGTAAGVARGILEFVGAMATGGVLFRAVNVATKLQYAGKYAKAVKMMGQGAVADFITTNARDQRLLQWAESQGGAWATMVPDYLGAPTDEEANILSTKLKGMVEGALLGGVLDLGGVAIKRGMKPGKKLVDETMNTIEAVRNDRQIAQGAVDVVDTPELIQVKNSIKKAVGETESETMGVVGNTFKDIDDAAIIKEDMDIFKAPEVEETGIVSPMMKDTDEAVGVVKLDAEGKPVVKEAETEVPAGPASVKEKIEKQTETYRNNLKATGKTDAEIDAMGNLSDYAGQKRLDEAVKLDEVVPGRIDGEYVTEIDGYPYLNIDKINNNQAVSTMWEKAAKEANESLGAKGMSMADMERQGVKALKDVEGWIGQKAGRAFSPGEAVAARKMYIGAQNTITKLSIKAASSGSKADLAALMKAKAAYLDVTDVILRGRKATGQSLKAWDVDTGAALVHEAAGNNLGIKLLDGTQVNGARVIKTMDDMTKENFLFLNSKTANLKEALDSKGKLKKGFTVVDADNNIVDTKNIADMGIDMDAIKAAKKRALTYQETIRQGKLVDDILRNEAYDPKTQALLISDIARKAPQNLDSVIRDWADMVDAGLVKENAWTKVQPTAGKIVDDLQKIRINGMLSNPGTHITNFSTNAFVALSSTFEAGVARGLADKSLGSAVHVMSRRAAGLFMGMREGLQLALSKDLPTGGMLGDLTSGLKADSLDGLPTSAFAGSDSWFYKNIWSGFMKAVNVPGGLLQRSDVFWKAANYRGSMYVEIDDMLRRAIDAGDMAQSEYKEMFGKMLANPTKELKDKALDVAKIQTFTKDIDPNNKVASTLQDVSRSKIGSLLLPFFRTPYNITKYGFERTPGLNMFVKESRDKLLRGTRAQKAEEISKLMTGSMILGTAAVMLPDNIISGAGPKDPGQRRALEASGWQPFSIKIGNRWVSYERYQPMSMILGLGAELRDMDSAGVEGEKKDKGIIYGLSEITKMMSDATFMQGIANVINTVSKGGNPEYLVKNLASSFIPFSGAARFVSTSIDPTMRDTRVDTEQGLFGATIEHMRSTIGWNGDLPVTRDAWGREREVFQDGESGVMYGLGIRTKKAAETKLDKMVAESGVSLGMPARKINGIDLSNEQYDRFLELSGSIARERMERLVDSGVFDGKPTGPDSLFDIILKREIRSARALAKQTLLVEDVELKMRSIARLGEADPDVNSSAINQAYARSGLSSKLKRPGM